MVSSYLVAGSRLHFTSPCNTRLCPEHRCVSPGERFKPRLTVNPTSSRSPSQPVYFRAVGGLAKSRCESNAIIGPDFKDPAMSSAHVLASAGSAWWWALTYVTIFLCISLGLVRRFPHHCSAPGPSRSAEWVEQRRDFEGLGKL